MTRYKNFPPDLRPLAAPFTMSSSTQRCIYKLGRLGRLFCFSYSWESISRQVLSSDCPHPLYS